MTDGTIKLSHAAINPVELLRDSYRWGRTENACPDCPFLWGTSAPPVLLRKRVSQIAYCQSFLAVIPRREHDGVETRISLRRDAQYGSETEKAVAR